MDKPQFVYVTYIATTPEKLWTALLDGEITRQYWGHRNVSDWKKGSTWTHQRAWDGSNLVVLVGKVVEIDPPRRLVLTWADPTDAKDEARHSRVTFDIEPLSGTVRLTVTHDRLEPGSEMERGITRGWPAVLSSLKTMLETGEPLAGFEWYRPTVKR
jgi:uncharacterized protein YndB with AHSA1/START domain